MSNSDPTSPGALPIEETGRCWPLYSAGGPPPGATDECCLCGGSVPRSNVEISDRLTGDCGGVCDQCCQRIDPDMFAVVQQLRALDELLAPHAPGLHQTPDTPCGHIATSELEGFIWGAMSALCVHADREFRPANGPTPGGMTTLPDVAGNRPIDDAMVEADEPGGRYISAVADGVKFRMARGFGREDSEFIAGLIREKGHVPGGKRYGRREASTITDESGSTYEPMGCG